MQLEPGDCIELVQTFKNNPRILKSTAFLQNKSKIKFSLAAWFIGRTDISVQLVSSILESRVSDASKLEDYAYICNYVKLYEPEVMNATRALFIKFYNYGIDAELRPLFIKLLSSFCCGEIPEEWQEILLLNWRDGPRDLAHASLQSLLECNIPCDFFNDLQQFERIDNLSVLANVLLSSSRNEKVFALFRNRISVASSQVRFKVKNVKIEMTSSHASSTSQWAESWGRVIETMKSWPVPSNVAPIDLLSKLTLSAITTDRYTFKSFLTCFKDASDEVKLKFLSDLIPETLDQCTWLFSALPRPLLQLFSHLLKNVESSQEILLALCRLFMDNFLGTSARKSFVNYLAAHVEDDQIGKRCLGLIESFVERFPDSRYICLALVKNLLEGVGTWEPSLLEPFYSSFSLMARSSDSVMNDLILLLKKQIYSSDVLYKRIGARGVGVFLSTNGLSDRIKAHEESLLPDPDDTFNDIASCSQKPRDMNPVPVKCDYHLRIIISLLEESVKSLRSDRQSMAIFLKYVNNSFNSLDEELRDWIGDWTRSIFQSAFISQIDEDAHKYKYEQDEDNPLALDFSNEEFRDSSAVLLSILGKFEKYQSAGSLESIDALQGCVIQMPSEGACSSISEDFHLKFIVLNYFRTVLNVFEGENSRLEVSIKIQQELRELLKTKPAFLAEFRLFPECQTLIQLNSGNILKGDDDFFIPKGSFLESLLQDARKPENRANRSISSSSADQQLCEVNETSFQKALIPLNISLLDRIASSVHDKNVPEFIYKEIDCLIETKYRNDIDSQRTLLDVLIKLMPIITVEGIEVILKCKKETISISQRATLLKLCKEIFKPRDNDPYSLILTQNVCKLLIDVLKCPELISDPMNLVKTCLSNSNKPNGVLKSLLMLPNLEINNLINEIKNEKVSLKNRLILLKAFAYRFAEKLKCSEIGECQRVLLIWADLIQFIRSTGIQKLLQGIVKDSHVVLESFLSSNSLKQVEVDALLLEESGQRESVILLLKTAQQSTRGLQIICNHLKYSKSRGEKSNDSLSIPNLKKTLETLIFRVKEILTRSGCLGAFWMGNLKHRDLDGQEISSQVELMKLTEDSEDEEGAISSESEKLSEEFIYDSNDSDNSSSDSGDETEPEEI